MNPLDECSFFCLTPNSNVKESFFFFKQTEEPHVMNTVRCRQLAQTNELTCIISYIFSACGKAGEVTAPIRPVLACSSRQQDLLYAYVGGGAGVRSIPTARLPPVPKQQELPAVAL